MFGYKTIVATALLSLATFTQAAPVSTPENLEKRITHWGRATYFEVGLGACGWWNKDADFIVALNSAIFQGNGGSNCGQMLTITYNGVTATAQVADECPTCGDQDLDLSPSLFGYLTNYNYDMGQFQMSWHFLKR